MAAGSVTSTVIGTGAVTSTHIADGAIMNADINASAAIAASKISGTAWTGSNDGSGSGLDADVIDGLPVNITSDISYCKTSSTYTGNLGGISGANAKCVTGCGAGYVFASLNTACAPSAASNATYYSWDVGWTNTSLGLRRAVLEATCDDGAAWGCSKGTDCASWTSANGMTEGGTSAPTTCMTESNAPCNSSKRILCRKVTI